MKFMMAEYEHFFINLWGMKGGIGLFYNSTGGAILTYVVFALFSLFAVIGLITVVKTLVCRKKKSKETPEEKWLRTGK